MLGADGGDSLLKRPFEPREPLLPLFQWDVPRSGHPSPSPQKRGTPRSSVTSPQRRPRVKSHQPQKESWRPQDQSLEPKITTLPDNLPPPSHHGSPSILQVLWWSTARSDPEHSHTNSVRIYYTSRWSGECTLIVAAVALKTCPFNNEMGYCRSRCRRCTMATSESRLAISAEVWRSWKGALIRLPNKMLG